MRYFKSKDIQQMSDAQLMSFKTALDSFDCQSVKCADCAFCTAGTPTEIDSCAYNLIIYEQARRAEIYDLRRKHYLFDEV